MQDEEGKSEKEIVQSGHSDSGLLVMLDVFCACIQIQLYCIEEMWEFRAHLRFGVSFFIGCLGILHRGKIKQQIITSCYLKVLFIIVDRKLGWNIALGSNRHEQDI